MSINDVGSGFYIEPPDWITEEVAFKIRRAKEDLPKDFLLQTIEKDFGLAIYVEANMFERYTVEQKVAIATRLNQLRDEIEDTGCPVWIDKY